MARRTADRLREMTVDELREQAKERGISGTSHMRKDELIEALTGESEGRRAAASHRKETHGGNTEHERKGDHDRKTDHAHKGEHERRGEHERKGERSGEPIGDSKAVHYAQHITSADEHEERPGRSLATRDHEVIQRWAEERDAVPATVPGTEHGDRLGVLRFNFPGYGGQDLREVSWEEWFATFDERRLNFIYQEHRSDGKLSNFFRLDNPEREDA